MSELRTHTRLAVLVPPRDDAPAAPEDTPIGRAALALADDGIELVFATSATSATGAATGAGRVAGHVARPGRYEPVADVAVAAAYDRFPWRLDPDGYDALIRGLGAVPIANPPALMRVCQDKVASQRLLESSGIPVPPLEPDPARFEAARQRWGAVYRKPRYGTAGRGVVRVAPDAPWPPPATGPRAAADGPPIVQRAVPPLPGWRGVCVRVAIQREPGGWYRNPAVARRSRDDWVVNAARGADVRLADTALAAPTMAAIGDVCDRVIAALAAQPDAAWLIEVGVDVVVGADGRPWVLELNSRPLGRLGALAARDPARFGALHRAAVERPLRALAALAARAAQSAPPAPTPPTSTTLL